jgi:hypothetical protein
MVVKIYFLSFCQLMLQAPVSQDTALLFMNTYVD